MFLATLHGAPVKVAASEGCVFPFRPEVLLVSGLEAEQQTLECASLSRGIIGTSLVCTRPTLWWISDGQGRALLVGVLNRASIPVMRL